MKNLVANIKANKARYIRRTLVIAGTVAAIALVGYAYKRGTFADDTVGDLTVVELDKSA